jgi:hypothetical protein
MAAGLGARRFRFPVINLVAGTDYPLDNPSAPSGWDTFTPPNADNAAASAPLISYATQDADPDDGICITGDGWTSGTYFIFYAQSMVGNGTMIADKAQKGNISGLALTTNTTNWRVPPELPHPAAIMVAAVDSSGNVGAPFIINTAQAWTLLDIGTAANPELGTAYESCIVGNRVAVLGANLTSKIVSTDAITVGTGSIAFTVPSGLTITTGAYFCAKAKFGGNSTLFGTVASYSGTTLTATVTSANGSGTYSYWEIYTADGTRVYLTPHGSTGGGYITPTLTNGGQIVLAEPGRVYFTLPTTIGSHGTLNSGDTFDVWVRNQQGGSYGWSKCPVVLTVTTAALQHTNWPTVTGGAYQTVAAPTGVPATDLANINTAITTAQGTAGPIRIKLQAGPPNYVINAPPSAGWRGSSFDSILIEGQGAGNTTLQAGSSWSGSYLVDGSQAFRIELRNLTLDGNGQTMTAMYVGARAISCILKPGVSPTVTVLASDLVGGQLRALLYNSSIYGITYTAKAAFIDSCTQYTRAPNDGCLVDLYGNLLCANSTFLQWPGEINGRGRVMSTSLAAQRYPICFSNITTNLNVEDSCGDNSGEQILFHPAVSVGQFDAAVTAYDASSGVSKVSVASGAFSSGLLSVISGKGLGQCGRIISSSGGTQMTLDVLFRVALDTSSTVSVMFGNSRVHLFASTFQSDGPCPDTGGNAACGTLCPNESSNSQLFVDGCTVSGMQHGLQLRTDQVDAALSALTQMLYKNIVITDCGEAVLVYGTSANGYIYGVAFRNVVSTNDNFWDIIHDNRSTDLVLYDKCWLQGGNQGLRDIVPGGSNSIIGRLDMFDSFVGPPTPANFSGSQGHNSAATANDATLFGTSRAMGFASNNLP